MVPNIPKSRYTLLRYTLGAKSVASTYNTAYGVRKVLAYRVAQVKFPGPLTPIGKKKSVTSAGIHGRTLQGAASP
jgi:hypothetical protein